MEGFKNPIHGNRSLEGYPGPLPPRPPRMRFSQKVIGKEEGRKPPPPLMDVNLFFAMKKNFTPPPKKKLRDFLLLTEKGGTPSPSKYPYPIIP